MNKTLTLGLVQHSCNTSPADNLRKSIDGVRSAAQQGAQLVLLQELHTTHYFCQQQSIDNFKYAESIPGPSSDRLARLAAELNIVIVASIFERRAAGIYHNTAVVLDGQHGMVGRYRKMHIPDDPGYYEKYYFTPGDFEATVEAGHETRIESESATGLNNKPQGFEPIDTSVGRLGVMVCWDQWFPEAARLMTLAGAEILLYPTAIGWDKQDAEAEQATQQDAWVTIQRSHAIANGLPVAACNRTGFEPALASSFSPPDSDTANPASTGNNAGHHDRQTQGIQFWGSSFIAGSQGEIIIQATANEQEVIVASVDLAHNENVRQAWPYLRDRRIDAYSGLLKRYLK